MIIYKKYYFKRQRLRRLSSVAINSQIIATTTTSVRIVRYSLKISFDLNK